MSENKKDKPTDEKKQAKIVFKRFKACGFNIKLLKQRFSLTEEEISGYNKIYGWRFGKIR